MTREAIVATYPGITIQFREFPYHAYTVNGDSVPSVTQVLGILDKPALMNWAARVTAEGAYRLIKRKGYELPSSARDFQDDMRRYGYDHRSQTKAAQERGVDVHTILQDWAESQRLPAISDYPHDRRGYIRGLARFLMEHQPRFVEAERLVASLKHGFAGRRDTVAIVEDLDGRRCLLDLKTSKGIYPSSMFRQLAAYELAGVECGEPPTDMQGIVRVGADGEYEIAWSDATAEDFLSVLRVWKDEQKWKRYGR